MEANTSRGTEAPQPAVDSAPSRELAPHARVPEVLAPAGGRAQFFAALNAGADAVYLGLKTFNARARAENFTIDDLKELVPIAHQFGMKVLVAVNILIKQNELDDLVATLADLEMVGVDAIIVQDLTIARIARESFPGLRLHASTQMAVHNLAGVTKAAAWGFKRVVLAREMTATELQRLHARLPAGVEIEAFCHGSLCYSYSGLCFFSGADDARSGNRGECAYTCRKPYKIINEPGHGFLFSMRDLDTSRSLDLLVQAGVDCLKIEGRKKDAQYVSSVVRLYRKRLDELFGRPTLRASAPEGARRATEQDDEAAIRADLALSFQRRPTSFFLKNRYHENVIDLDNPTHLGLELGRVTAVKGRVIQVMAAVPVERFDGLKVQGDDKVFHAKPQDGDEVRAKTTSMAARYHNETYQFSLREFRADGRKATTAPAGAMLEIELPDDAPRVAVGSRVYKVRSADLKRRVKRQEAPPADTRLRAMRPVNVKITATVQDGELSLTAAACRFDMPIATCAVSGKAEKARLTGQLPQDVQATFRLFGDFGFYVEELDFAGDPDWFVPRSLLKDLKKRVGEALLAHYDRALQTHQDDARGRLLQPTEPPAQVLAATRRYAVKIDRLDYLEALDAFVAAHPDFPLAEVVFEPKRASVGTESPRAIIERLVAFSEKGKVPLRMAMPTVIRAWDEPLLKKWLEAAHAAGIAAVEVGNVGALELLDQWQLAGLATSISSDFTLYTLNAEASAFWADQGIETIALSIEDDLGNIEAHLAHWPWQSGARPQAVIYKDTPLFIAEACSLTALHNGCPTAKVCGYRTLEIENEEGERFFVAHENCKSIVYGKEAYAIAEKQNELERLGIKQFRIDFLTRDYSAEEIGRILGVVWRGVAVPATHTANFGRRLL